MFGTARALSKTCSLHSYARAYAVRNAFADHAIKLAAFLFRDQP
jgi:hypothetical protein